MIAAGHETSFSLSNTLSTRKELTKDTNCEIYDTIDDNYNCNVRNVVYQFKCNFCKKIYRSFTIPILRLLSARVSHAKEMSISGKLEFDYVAGCH